MTMDKDASGESVALPSRPCEPLRECGLDVAETLSVDRLYVSAMQRGTTDMSALECAVRRLGRRMHAQACRERGGDLRDGRGAGRRVLLRVEPLLPELGGDARVETGIRKDAETSAECVRAVNAP